eukprot:5959505-Pleurochrysis_carterae.AAC.2
MDCATQEAARQRDRNIWPGMLTSDYDWAENGVIASARQIQSEYWSLKYFSLFITITSFLVTEAWLSRSSHLPESTHVMVEPENAQPGTTIPPLGSFVATIVHAPPLGADGSELYTVQPSESTTLLFIPRYRLRHRKLHTTALACITDDKRHDAPTTQHMLNRQLQQCWRIYEPVEKFFAWLGTCHLLFIRMYLPIKANSFCYGTAHSPIMRCR